MKWFRFYSEFMDDPKIAMMSDSDQLLWVKALCLASDSSTRGEICLTDEEICWKLRINPETWRHAVDKFRAKGMLEHIKGGYKIVNWHKRQFESDNVSQRVAKQRASKDSTKKKQLCNVTGNKTVTPSEQIQIQNTDPDSDPDSEHKNSVLPLYSLNADTENQKEGEVVEPSQGFCEEERPEPKLEALTPINPTGLSRPILHSPTPQVPQRPLRHDFLPEQGSGVYLWNENAKFTVYIPTGDKNRMESACAAFVFKQHEKLSEPSETTANCWLSAVKMLRTNIWQQQQRGQFTSTSIEVIAEEVNTERDMPRLAEVFSSDLNFSIVSVENQRATLVGTAKIAAYTTNPRLSLTLTASLQDQKEVNTWLTMCEFFVPTVTNVEPMTLGHGSRTPNPAPNILPFGQSFNNPESKSWFEWQTGPGPNDYDPEFVDFLAGKWNRSKADVKRFFQKNRSNPEAISVYFEDFKGSDNDLQQVVANVMRRKMEARHGFAANW